MPTIRRSWARPRSRSARLRQGSKTGVYASGTRRRRHRTSHCRATAWAACAAPCQTRRPARRRPDATDCPIGSALGTQPRWPGFAGAAHRNPHPKSQACRLGDRAGRVAQSPWRDAPTPPPLPQASARQRGGRPHRTGRHSCGTFQEAVSGSARRIGDLSAPPASAQSPPCAPPVSARSRLRSPRRGSRPFGRGGVGRRGRRPGGRG